MKTLTRLVLALVALALSTSGLRAGDPPSTGYFEAIEKEAPPVVGEQYYMRHCLRYETGKLWETTNYWTDSSVLVPINSKVTLTSLGKTMQIKIEKTGQVLTIENILKYSQKDLTTIAKNMLTRTPVPLEKFDEKVAKNIRNGILSLGMTKEQVVMTRGYPPGHKTPSLEIDSWTYWNNRFGTHLLIFQDGVLTKGRGLQ